MVKPEKGRARNSAKILYPEGGPGVPVGNKNVKHFRYNGMLFKGKRICIILFHFVGQIYSFFE